MYWKSRKMQQNRPSTKMKTLYSEPTNGNSMRRKGAALPINTTAKLTLEVIAAVFFLGIIISLFMTQSGGFQMCVGPFKSFYAGIADMTGVNMCS